MYIFTLSLNPGHLGLDLAIGTFKALTGDYLTKCSDCPVHSP